MTPTVNFSEMAAFRVRALYDFTGEPGTAELSVTAGEILTVSRTDVGEGWWEGTNFKGQSGLFPAAYVETLPPESSAPPSRPPPVLPPTQRYDETPIEDIDPAGGDAWEDDWDDETYSEIVPPDNHNNHQGSDHHQISNIYANTSEFAHATDDNHSIASGPVNAKKNLYRISIMKSGGDSYILGTFNPPPIPETEKAWVIQTDENNYSWAPITDPYTVLVASPKKESKFKGIKSFIAYQLTPSFNNIQVSRRYKHFDWLHERLVEKFCLIPIPPLPDKQISGRYEDSFIEQRRTQLQEFVDWVCRHPILSKCEVWNHFLTCTDEKRWKLGKRQAEKDPLVGFNSCALIFAPDKSLLQSQVEMQTDACSTFVHTMDNAVKTLMATCCDQIKKQQNIYKREYQRIGEAFFSLGSALALDENKMISSNKLTKAAQQLGGAYIDIGKYFEDHLKFDWEPLNHKLHIHRGILGGFPDILSVHKQAMNKKKECEKLTSEHKMEMAQMNDVTRRTDVISYALLAEVSHVRTERDSHLKHALKVHLQEQIKFYQKIVERLQNVQQFFED